MGAYPTVVDWNNDSNHDLLVGDTNGDVIIYLNTNNNTNPILDSGTVILNNGDDRATPVVNDWNEDGKKDLLVGNLTGNIQVYLNVGTDSAPSFSTPNNLQVGGSVFDIGSRAAPRINDWDGDGLKDILVGEVSGNIYYLRNVGTNSNPVFNSSEKLLLLTASPLTYISNPASTAPRSRLDIVDWNEDGLTDIVVGGQDGRVMLFMAAPEPVSSTLFIIGGGILGLLRLRKKYRN